MNSDHTTHIKCHHLPCSCGVTIPGDYCGDACREAAALAAVQIESAPAEGRLRCPCAHQHCSAAGISLDEAQGLLLASESLSAG